jgi:hypothetical protein
VLKLFSLLQNTCLIKTSLSDLPSSSTAVNMMDRAQVLSKYQVAEEVLETDRWDLHSDGTSRHQKDYGMTSYFRFWKVIVNWDYVYSDRG